MNQRFGISLVRATLSLCLVSASLAQGSSNDTVHTKDTGGSAAITFHLAKDKPAPGYLELKSDAGRKVYVSRRVLFTSGDILAIRVRTGDSGEYIEFSLPPAAADVLTSSIRSSGNHRVALMKANRLATIASVDLDSGAQPRLVGFRVGTAADVVRMMKEPKQTRTPAVLSVVPRKSTGRPTDLFVFDIFISDAPALRTFQLTLDASGGLGGRLDRGGGTIDQNRPDFVFHGDGQVIAAVDDLGARFGALVMKGAQDVSDRKYLGSYSFRASDAAIGTFTVTVRQTKDTILADAQSKAIPYRVEPATVTIGAK